MNVSELVKKKYGHVYRITDIDELRDIISIVVPDELVERELAEAFILQALRSADGFEALIAFFTNDCRDSHIDLNRDVRLTPDESWPYIFDVSLIQSDQSPSETAHK